MRRGSSWTRGFDDGHGRRRDPPWSIDDLRIRRFEDKHVEPYVHLRRISADPAIPPGDVPAQRHVGRSLASVRHAVLIQSGEFIVDGEGSYRPGELRWVRAGVAYGPERAGAEGAVL